MDQAVPAIYSRDTLPPNPGLWARAAFGLLSLACLACLVTGAWLQPGAAGYGTHQQLGLAPCAFEARTGLPCPSCGFTTSVTHFVHGNWLASLYLQPMGFVVAVFFAVAVWVGAYIAATGRPVYRLLARLNGRGWAVALFAVAIAGWGWKIFIHLSNRDHWPP